MRDDLAWGAGWEDGERNDRNQIKWNDGAFKGRRYLQRKWKIIIITIINEVKKKKLLVIKKSENKTPATKNRKRAHLENEKRGPRIDTCPQLSNIRRVFNYTFIYTRLSNTKHVGPTLLRVGNCQFVCHIVGVNMLVPLGFCQNRTNF